MQAEVKKVVDGRNTKSTHQTIFEALSESDLPPEEKAVDRLTEEGFALILAGADTSTQALMHTSFHLLDNPAILSRLQAELRQAIPDPDAPLGWQELEKLPFLVRSKAVRTSSSTEQHIECLHYGGVACGLACDCSFRPCCSQRNVTL